MSGYMFIDAETDGLYGQVLSVAAIVANEDCVEYAHFYGKQKINLSDIQDEWVREHVYPILSDAPEYESEDALLEAFWEFYVMHPDCFVIADVPYPVECLLFRKCVAKDENNRKSLAPFPLMDLSSMLYAKGINPLEDRTKLLDRDENMHNALTDARVGLEIYKKYIG